MSTLGALGVRGGPSRLGVSGEGEGLAQSLQGWWQQRRQQRNHHHSQQLWRPQGRWQGQQQGQGHSWPQAHTFSHIWTPPGCGDFVSRSASTLSPPLQHQGRGGSLLVAAGQPHTPSHLSPPAFSATKRSVSSLAPTFQQEGQGRRFNTPSHLLPSDWSMEKHSVSTLAPAFQQQGHGRPLLAAGQPHTVSHLSPPLKVSSTIHSVSTLAPAFQQQGQGRPLLVVQPRHRGDLEEALNLLKAYAGECGGCGKCGQEGVVDNVGVWRLR